MKTFQAICLALVLPGLSACQGGSGDSSAGGFMGYLAQSGKTDFETLRTAVAYGTVVASFTVADFSLNGLTAIKRTDIDKRLQQLQSITHF